MKRGREEGDESNGSGLSNQENEKLQNVLCGRVNIDNLGFSTASNSKITLSSSMEMLQSLPDSVRGCLMEAARLCAPPINEGDKGGKTTASVVGAATALAQGIPNLSATSSAYVASDHSLLESPGILSGIGLDESSLQALQKIHSSLFPTHFSIPDDLEIFGDKSDIFSSILAHDFPTSDNDLHSDFLNSSQVQTPSSADSEQWSIQGIENMLSILAPSCY